MREYHGGRNAEIFWTEINLFVHFVCLPICLSITSSVSGLFSDSICPSVWLCLSVHQFVYLSISQHVDPSVRLFASVFLFICQSVNLSVRLTVCRSVCQFVCLTFRKGFSDWRGRINVAWKLDATCSWQQDARQKLALVDLSQYLSVCWSFSMSVCLSICWAF